ncbi:SGNH/GDSL hydrolase family protein [Mongoliitalea daihaiensis]|uniref:SGNH/GDSL hydrolase family protein n=1 Tax=Mongoliitalea daihaiensis TaxID=2782006 RepID=UPI001F245566|nr:SGNH/GDSL hydrolase family protein [Mongoliitalea daihaiensis]UJP63589.1 SGNH/GDSL hydrolase family protein [Mongoliitalea daihaiensis]
MIQSFFIGLCLAATLNVNIMQEKPTPPSNEHLRYLALGDSYTIGEGVAEEERYPNQAVAILQAQGLEVNLSQIIAKTGWTTDELVKGIEAAGIVDNTYDLVTLLIGVNNQYRRRTVENYEEELQSLIHQAIAFAKGNPKRVIVLSIPDWGITPFGKESGRDLEENSIAIDTFNATKKAIAEELGVFYIDITEEYRNIGGLDEMVVEDKLHPSGLVYKSWAEKLSQVIVHQMKF